MAHRAVILGALSLALGAVSLSLAFFVPIPTGAAGLLAGILGLIVGLDLGKHDNGGQNN